MTRHRSDVTGMNEQKRSQFAMIPLEAIPELDDAGVRLYAYLGARYGGMKAIFPSVARIAVDLGWCERKAHQVIARARKSGWVRVDARPGKTSFFHLAQSAEQAQGWATQVTSDLSQTPQGGASGCTPQVTTPAPGCTPTPAPGCTPQLPTGVHQDAPEPDINQIDLTQIEERPLTQTEAPRLSPRGDTAIGDPPGPPARAGELPAELQWEFLAGRTPKFADLLEAVRRGQG